MENLWTLGAFPVDEPWRQRFFVAPPEANDDGQRCGCNFRMSLRLIRVWGYVEFEAPERQPYNKPPTRTVKRAVHHFKELINGTPYVIEVSRVGDDRWRAYIVRIPGVPTALMPFYGATPDQAAEQLREWLTRAHERAALQGSRV